MKFAKVNLHGKFPFFDKYRAIRRNMQYRKDYEEVAKWLEENNFSLSCLEKSPYPFEFPDHFLSEWQRIIKDFQDESPLLKDPLLKIPIPKIIVEIPETSVRKRIKQFCDKYNLKRTIPPLSEPYLFYLNPTEYSDTPDFDYMQYFSYKGIWEVLYPLKWRKATENEKTKCNA